MPQENSELQQAPDSNSVPVVPSGNDGVVADALTPTGEAVVEAVVTQITRVQKSHSGPLPDIETLRGYSELIEDGAERVAQMAEKEAERIARMAEKEQEHAHQMDVAQSRRQDGAEK